MIIAVLIVIATVLIAIYAVANSRGKINHLQQECQTLRSQLEQPNTQQHGNNHKKQDSRAHAGDAENHARQQNKPDSGSEANKLRQEVQALTHQLQLAKKETQKKIEQEIEQRLQEKQGIINRLSKEIESCKEKQKRREAQERASRKALPPELQQLPETILPQVARVYRKGEQNEQLLALGRGKLLLVQERLSELQKRYFAVCRELALATNSSDQKADADNGERQADETSNNSELSQQKKTQDEGTSSPEEPTDKKTLGPNAPKDATETSAKNKTN